MRTALVTGARGFIGVHLVESLLERGLQVRCLVREKSLPKDLAGLDVELVEGDVCHYETLVPAVRGMDAVFHLAGLTSALRNKDLMQTNSQGTDNVARACASSETPPVHVVVSSIAAAGPSTAGLPRNNDDLPSPVSNYGRSKLAGEKAAAAWAAKIPTTVVRPGIVFGERNRELFPMFYSIDRFRLHPHPNVRSTPLSVIYVKDLVELMWRAATRGERVDPVRDDELPCGKGYYFACADEYPSYATWGRMIGSALARQPVIVLPLFFPIPSIVGGLNEVIARLRRQSNSLNYDKIREANARSWACSPELARTQLGFEPRRPLMEQLRKTARWYREHEWL